MSKNNLLILNQYLAENAREQKNPFDKQQEYYCLTCQINGNIEKLIAFEKDHKESYVPVQIRKIQPIGVIFIQDSILFEYHQKFTKEHNWGKYNI